MSLVWLWTRRARPWSRSVSSTARLSFFFRKHPDGKFRHRPDVHLSASPECWLTPVLPLGVERVVGLSDGRDLQILDVASGVHWPHRRISVNRTAGPWSALLLPASADQPCAAWPADDLDSRRCTLGRY